MARPFPVLLPVGVALLLAGCVMERSGGTGEEGGPEGPGGADGGLGSIEGIVVNEAITPLAGVAVSVEPGGLAATTDAAGSFRFAGLPVGAYTVRAALAGYVDATLDVTTGQGLVQLVLRTDTGAVRYVEAVSQEGFVEYSANLVGARTSNSNAPNFTFEGRIPDAIQIEMVWQSTQAAGERMDLTLIANDGGNLLPVAGRAEGTSPLMVHLNATTIEEFRFGPEVYLDIAVFVGEEPVAGGEGAGASLQQRFTLFVHMFYGYAPPEGWRFTADGEAPPPTTSKE